MEKLKQKPGWFQSKFEVVMFFWVLIIFGVVVYIALDGLGILR